jgi:type IV pilus assembly protein PilB
MGIGRAVFLLIRESDVAARIGELLLKAKGVTSEQLQSALLHQRQRGGTLDFSLVALGHIEADRLTALLSRHYGVPSIELGRFEVDSTIVNLVPPETAQKYQVVPLSRAASTLTVAMTDPTNVAAIDDIKFITGCNVEPVVAPEMVIVDAIERYYGKAAAVKAVPATALELASEALENMTPSQVTDDGRDGLREIRVHGPAERGPEAPVIRLVDVLMLSAIHKGASDIHIEPYEKELRVRFRIDGVLYTVMRPPMKLRDALTSRIKIMARLDIAEKRLPQDGRIKMRFQENGSTKDIDFRVSCLPTLFGEKIVLRLLDRDTLMLDMTRLGFEPESLVKFEAAIQKPWGMVLVTGPTGSGKTNTLYSSISRINTSETNILTAEDPVEFNLAGVNQLQVRDNIGLTFAASLRSFLRQDPNVILVGEIRDFETAEIAVKAALTGHLVLSTVHTNDAPSTVTRLMNMGIDRFLAASSLNLVCAQRLVRRICRNCIEPSRAPVSALLEAGFSTEDARRVIPRKGAGCATCNHTGYSGRIGLFEVMDVADAIRELILVGASAHELRRKAVDEGMLTLRTSGLRKVADGVTTIDEVIRETAG